MAKVGIFWVYQHQVIGQICALDEAEMGVSGLLDSPDTHYAVWPAIAVKVNLCNVDYMDVPRGRVLFDVKRQRAIIYMDRVLADQKQQIRTFFDLCNVPITWRPDPHYTVNQQDITDLLDD